jgi:hypothetical protein
MEAYTAGVEWNQLPTPIWPEGSVMADVPGLILEASFDQGAPTWKVEKKLEKCCCRTGLK